MEYKNAHERIRMNMFVLISTLKICQNDRMRKCEKIYVFESVGELLQLKVNMYGRECNRLYFSID